MHGIITPKTTLLIIQIQGFEKVHLLVVGDWCCGFGYSILTNDSKEGYSLESGLKVSIPLGKGD